MQANLASQCLIQLCQHRKTILHECCKLPSSAYNAIAPMHAHAVSTCGALCAPAWILLYNNWCFTTRMMQQRCLKMPMGPPRTQRCLLWQKQEI